MPGSGLSAGAVAVPRRERMAAACRCSRCAAWQPERRRPPRSFSFGIICESCYATARKENIGGYVRYRSPSVPTSALARRGRAVFPQRPLPRRPSTALLAERRSTAHLRPPFPAAAATRGPPALFHRAAPSGLPAQRCRRPTALLPAAPTLRPRTNIPAVIFKDFWEPFALCEM